MNENTHWVTYPIVEMKSKLSNDISFTISVLNSANITDDNNIFYNQPMIHFKIVNFTLKTKQKCILFTHHICDLLKTCQDALHYKDLTFKEQTVISKSYSSKATLLIKFEQGNDSSHPKEFVSILIMRSENDYIVYKMYFDEFMIFLSSLNNIYKNIATYHTAGVNCLSQKMLHIKNNMMISSLTSLTSYLNSLVERITSNTTEQISVMKDIRNINNSDSLVNVNKMQNDGSELGIGHNVTDVIDESPKNIQEEFVNFCHENISKVEIKELQKLEKYQATKEFDDNGKRNIIDDNISSYFFDNVCRKDMKQIVNITNCLQFNDPEYYVINKLNSLFFDYFDENMLLCFGQPDKDNPYPSLFYLYYEFVIRLLYRSRYRAMIDYKIDLSQHIRTGYIILNESNITLKHIHLVYDILLIYSYFHVLTTILKQRSSDLIQNCFILYSELRTIFDIYVFSILKSRSINMDILHDWVLKKYNVYNEQDFFKEYDKKLTMFNLRKINQEDIKDSLKFHLSLMDDDKSVMPINEYYDSIRYLFPIPYEEDMKELSQEDLLLKLNSCVDFSISRMQGNKTIPEKYEFKDEFIHNTIIKISDRLHTKSAETNPQWDKRTSANVLHRYCKMMQLKDEYKSDEHRNKFLNHINGLDGKMFLEFDKYDATKLGFNILSALCTWNTDTERVDTKYTMFSSLVISFAERMKENVFNLYMCLKDSIAEVDIYSKRVTKEDMIMFNVLDDFAKKGE